MINGPGFDYEGLAISNMDSCDSPRVVFHTMTKNMEQLADSLASVTHNTAEEWFATIIYHTFVGIGCPDEVK